MSHLLNVRRRVVVPKSRSGWLIELVLMQRYYTLSYLFNNVLQRRCIQASATNSQKMRLSNLGIRNSNSTVEELKDDMPTSRALEKIQSQYPNVYARLLIYNFPFTVTRSDLVVMHRIKGVQVGDIIELDRILEVGSKDYKLRGQPCLPAGSVKVRATVMEHTHGAKKRAKMRRQRKGRRPLLTIKPLVTTLRVQDIIIDPQCTTLT